MMATDFFAIGVVRANDASERGASLDVVLVDELEPIWCLRLSMFKIANISTAKCSWTKCWRQFNASECLLPKLGADEYGVGYCFEDVGHFPLSRFPIFSPLLCKQQLKDWHGKPMSFPHYAFHIFGLQTLLVPFLTFGVKSEG